MVPRRARLPEDVDSVPAERRRHGRHVLPRAHRKHSAVLVQGVHDLRHAAVHPARPHLVRAAVFLHHSRPHQRLLVPQDLPGSPQGAALDVGEAQRHGHQGRVNGGEFVDIPFRIYTRPHRPPARAREITLGCGEICYR